MNSSSEDFNPTFHHLWSVVYESELLTTRLEQLFLPQSSYVNRVLFPTSKITFQ